MRFARSALLKVDLSLLFGVLFSRFLSSLVSVFVWIACMRLCFCSKWRDVTLRLNTFGYEKEKDLQLFSFSFSFSFSTLCIRRLLLVVRFNLNQYENWRFAQLNDVHKQLVKRNVGETKFTKTHETYIISWFVSTSKQSCSASSSTNSWLCRKRFPSSTWAFDVSDTDVNQRN